MHTFSKIVVVLELTGIALPISALLFIFGIPATIQQLLESWESDRVIIAVLAIVSVAATAAVWWLSVSFLRGSEVTGSRKAIAWGFVLTGIIVVLIAFLSRFMPQPEPYSEGWWFYDQLSTFILGAPLVVPAGHVFLASVFTRRR